ncbi:MAG TPA: hypothetical protein VFB13_18245 [Reyranella sp.]|nr:hypothetical protein [Reyranella sp.]
MRAVVAALLAAMAAGAPALAEDKATFSCGAFKVENWRSGDRSYWTIARGTERTQEDEILKKGPRFECIDGAVLALEFVPAHGLAFLDLYFPDGSDIGYGGQHFERNGRFVIPIQARARIPERFRGAFDYHCRMEMPADPIPAEARKDCVR